jgi:ElaB/YqjD/DUF883 family membrane-anchored ribosome-binding protein
MNGRDEYDPRPATSGGHDADPRRRGNGGSHGLEDNIERHRENIDQTLSELESKFGSGELIEQAIKHLASGTGDVLHSFKNAATNNPIPMALVGLGLAWMMFGEEKDQKSTKTADDQTPVGPTDHDIPELSDFRDIYMFCLQHEHPFDADQLECIIYEDLGPDALLGYTPHASVRGTIRAGQWGGGTAASTQGEASGLAGQATQATQGARDEALSRIYKTRSRMAEGGADTRERLDRARSEAWRRAKRAQSAVERTAREAKRRTSEIVDRYPLSIVALGVAAGAALGGVIPETEYEDRLMGEASDSLKEQGKTVMGEQIDRVKEVTAAAGQAAKEEVQAQGLDREDVGKHARSETEKPGQVAGAAHEDLQRQGVGDGGGEERIQGMP